jgi:hypothetical protein
MPYPSWLQINLTSQNPFLLSLFLFSRKDALVWMDLPITPSIFLFPLPLPLVAN